MQRSWYYSQDRTERQGPVSTDDLRAMLRDGRLHPDVPVWHDGMVDWSPASTQTALQSAGPPVAAPSFAPSEDTQGGLVPSQFGGWLRFVGICSIMTGILYCVTCVGILWGILLIVAGVALLGARTALDQMTEVPPAVVPFIQKLNTFFMVTGITYLIMLVGSALVLVFYGGILLAALSSLR